MPQDQTLWEMWYKYWLSGARSVGSNTGEGEGRVGWGAGSEHQRAGEKRQGVQEMAHTCSQELLMYISRGSVVA